MAYVCGFVWFCLLAHKSYNGGTYISENALLPGLVEGHFKSDSDSKKYLKSLENEIEMHRSDIPMDWLTEQFTQMGLETFTHNFTLRHPLGKNIIYTGNNVYAILRAPRTANTESVVITAPFRSALSPHHATLPGIALMLGLAKFLRQQVYLAKDIVFLITEHEFLGVQAWLEAYHRSSEPDQALDGGTLTGRAGSIQAAINLEIQSDRLSNLDVKVEGLNGQLPNLDLFNLVIRLCNREHVRATFHNKDDHYNPETPEGWIHSIKTMVSMMATQTTGIPSGNHGLFLRYNIEAVTLQGYPDIGDRRGRKSTLLQVGRVLEGIVRSLNNLQERFHQSFFLYLLPATDRYVSIGLYMPAFGLLIAPLALKALGLRVETNKEEETKKKKGKPKKQMSSFTSAFPLFLLSHLLGVVIWMSPEYLCKLGWHLEMTTEQSLTIGLCAIFVSSLALPFVVHRRDSSSSFASWKIIKCITLLELGIVLAPLSLINISLATLLTIFYSPVAVWIKPSQSWLASCFRSACLLLISPAVLGFLAVLAFTTTSFSAGEDLPQIFQRSLYAYQRAVVHSIFDSYIFGNWLFAVASTVLFPSWLMLWTVAHAPIL